MAKFPRCRATKCSDTCKERDLSSSTEREVTRPFKMATVARLCRLEAKSSNLELSSLYFCMRELTKICSSMTMSTIWCDGCFKNIVFKIQTLQIHNTWSNQHAKEVWSCLKSLSGLNTKKNYTSHIHRFKKFTGVFSTNQWLEITTKDLQLMLEDYAIHLRHTANPNSIPSMFRGIKHFFVMNRIDLNWDALIHFLASTRARIGVFDHTLTIKHIQKMPSGYMIVLL